MIGLAAGESAAEPVSRFLGDRFVNQSQRLTKALEKANDRAWATLEYALAGESLWERCTSLFSRARTRRSASRCAPSWTLCRSVPSRMRRPSSAGRRSPSCAEPAGKAFSGSASWTCGNCARQAGQFAGFANPVALLAAEKHALAELAGSFPGDHLAHLRRLLELTPAGGSPLLVSAVRYFFRRAVEEDSELFQGLAFILIEKQGDALETGLARLAELLTHHESHCSN